MKHLPTLASLLLCAALPLLAQADNAPGGCAEVAVDGYKAPDYGCLNQQMGSETNATKAAQKNREAQNIPVERRQPNKVGLATPAATSVRMGNTFGTSVKPQRP
ncbi:hypothetical protein NTD80_22580 [Pseudomonas sp. 13B_2.1_Bac1]|uniref:hypothetical protein n=1 Tax=Pseudomonas sp. 13B_2.1_Bac1 TaxID=2971624 RepID=UPI0021CADD75|nr:hypothetical protein [Pseudomonas sp. 13B_2.1_Bac1]MCU1785539.1 hypothetical protein [Pseudomonas sp. 13B_2.1_Bac1]